MPTLTYRLLGAAAWVVPLLWTVPWALIRGEFAHGGYVWWQQVHIGGLLLLVVVALAARTHLWRRRRSQHPRSVGAHVFGQSALVVLVMAASWLSFQTGLARHHPPESLSEFLWSDP
jgi:hypothetical protein